MPSQLVSVPALAADQMVDIAAIARAAQLSRRTIERMIRDRRFPAPIKFRRRNRWLARTVSEWVAARAAEATATPAGAAGGS